MKKLIFITSLLLVANILLGQTKKSFEVPTEVEQLGRDYVNGKIEAWQLTPTDIANLTVTNYHLVRSTGAHHLYFTQTYQGIPITDALVNLTVTADDKVYESGHPPKSTPAPSMYPR